MVSVSIRQVGIPPKMLFLRDDTTVPTGYTNQSCYYGKYLKHVPSCTNPGTCVGNATHTHTSGGCHSHSGCLSHSHSYGMTGPSTTGVGRENIGGASDVALSGHTHPGVTMASASPSYTTTSAGGHTHDAQNNTPLYRNYRLIKKDNNVSVRNKTLPKDTYLIWSKTLASIPSGWTKDCNLNTRLVKIDCCVASNGGNTNHTHANAGHSHTICISSHSHSVSGSLTAPGGAQATDSTSVPSDTHTHTLGSLSSSAATGSETSSSECHAHDSLSIIPASIETTLIKSSAVHMRSQNIPIGSSAMWDCTIASIPVTFANSDGTLGTTNYVDKYIIGIPTGCTNPGSSVGSNTHTHSSVTSNHPCGTHSHTHPGTGTSGGSSGSALGAATATVVSLNGHTHSGSTSGAGSAVSLSTSSGHTHGSQDHKPSSKEIAVIEKI